MGKWLLALLMTSTQLLVGSGGSVYLCVSRDGSHFCFDSGPDSCTCCRAEATSSAPASGSCGCPSRPGDSGGDCGSQISCCADEPDEHEQPAAGCEFGVLIAADLCGCVHFPIVIGSDQLPTIVRAAMRLDGTELVSVVVSPPVFIGYALSACPQFRWDEQLGRRADYSLIVISTVVMRC